MNNVKELSRMALFIALVAVATMIIKIPIPATGGYVNVGDSMIFFVALVFGKKYGGLCGGIGSALADLLSGYLQYAPITFVVKGLEGLIVALIFEKGKKNIFAPLASILGGIFMVGGYFFFEATVLGYGIGAAASIPANLIQAGVSVVIGQVLYFAYSAYVAKSE